MQFNLFKKKNPTFINIYANEVSQKYRFNLQCRSNTKMNSYLHPYVNKFVNICIFGCELNDYASHSEGVVFFNIKFVNHKHFAI